jgi:hypothetical protein
VDAARAGARLEAAQEASAVAQGTAREALAQTGQVLEIAARIELVDEKVTSLADYLVAQIEGAPAARRPGGRHALPAGDGPAAIAAGAGEEVAS